MKYAIIIADGAADFPLDVLGGKTPFEAADKPYTDSISVTGRQGTVATTPEGYSAGSDICCMSLLGYDPRQYHPGRAPLEAAAMGIGVDPGQWVFRCNLVTVLDGLMQDHSAGHISSAEGRRLIEEFAAQAAEVAGDHGLEFFPGVSYRNLMVDRSGRDYAELTSTPPHDIPGEPIKKYLPRGGPNAKLVQRLITESERLFAQSEINATRREMGESPATHAWLWGQGTPRAIESFQSRFAVRGAIITAVDLLAGIARLIGWDRLNVPGVTGYHDTDYAAKGRWACEALDRYDLVCVHVEAPDEASHQGDAPTKVASIEAIDRHIVGPVLEKLRSFEGSAAPGRAGGGWRILYLPDHYTRVDNRRHDSTPPPFCLAGTNIRGVRHLPFSESHSNASDLHITRGHELMEFFLRAGL